MSALLVILISILITSCISSLIGLAGFLIGYSFWASFCIGFAIQLFVGQLWNYFISRRADNITARIIAQNKLADSLQNVELNCAYCNISNIVRIILGRENIFDCTNCSNKNNVHIEFSTARITSPVIEGQTLSQLYDKLEKSKKQKPSQSVNNDRIEISSSRD